MGVPFECDLCHFRNLNKRSPEYTDPKDIRTLWAIRRASLDAFWAREPSTVRANLNRMRADYRDAHSMFSFEDTLPRPGNPRLEDRVGMGEALYYLAASLKSGRYTKHVQYETTRRTGSWITNLRGASGRDMDTEGRQGPVARRGDGPGGSREWITRFKRGMQLRMGQVRYQNEAFTGEMAVALHHLVEPEWREEQDEFRREELESMMCYVLIGLGAGLRGEEVPLTSCQGLATFWEETEQDDDPYVMVTLRGRFKAETGERWHCLPICDKNRSSIPYRTWIRRLLKRRLEEGAVWLLRGRSGRRARISDYDAMFVKYMHTLRYVSPEVFSVATIMELFSLRRSMRRGAIVATTGTVPESVVELINRWRKKEQARGSEANLNMRQTYAQVKSLYPKMKLYSRAI